MVAGDSAAQERVAGGTSPAAGGPKRRGAKPKYVCATKEEAVAKR